MADHGRSRRSTGAAGSPPLELLFTVDEETGLTGASNLKSGFLKSTTLLNLDSEEEGALYVGCSGGRNTIGTWKAVWQKAPGGSVPVHVQVRGLKGGTRDSRSTRGAAIPSRS